MAESVEIRLAKPEDMTSVLSMIQELADFEEMPDGPKITAKILQKDCFEVTPPLFKCFVAEKTNDNRRFLIGYAIFFNTYSTWEGKALMLEDIYVKPEYRKIGIGKKMFKTVAKLAVETECSRLDFHVLQWNPAKQFYEGLGARDLSGAEGWLFYRLAGHELSSLAAQ